VPRHAAYAALKEPDRVGGLGKLGGPGDLLVGLVRRIDEAVESEKKTKAA